MCLKKWAKIGKLKSCKKIYKKNKHEQINSKIAEITKLSSEKEKISEEKSLILRGVEKLNMMIDTL